MRKELAGWMEVKIKPEYVKTVVKIPEYILWGQGLRGEG